MSRLSFLLVLTSCWMLAVASMQATAQRPLFDEGAKLSLVSADFQLVDGAAWDGANRLFVPDVKAKKFFQLDMKKLEKAPKQLEVDFAVSGTCYQLGQLYLADNRGARIAIWNQNRVETLAQFEKDERPNDLAVDAAGNVYTTITSKGIVRRVSPNGEHSILVGDLERPNGIALSPSGNELFVSSFSTGVIYRIEIGDAETSQAEKLAQLPETADGFRGDGMCVDRAGNLYITGADAVHVFSPDGASLTSIKTPHRPINTIIAGADSRTLFVSTFGGLYAMPLNRYGVSPNRPTTGNASSPTSTVLPPTLQSEFNVVYAQDGTRELLMDVFTPADRGDKLPAILVVHGGGWKQGDKTKFRALALRLAEQGYVCAAIEYRLAGEAAFPAAIRDCNAATAYLRENANRLRIDPTRIGAVGGSAGGHLVGLMASGASQNELKHAANQDADTTLKAAVVLAGPLEIATGQVAIKSLKHSEKTPSNAVLWMDGSVEEKAELYHLADALEKVDRSMPPTLFICGSEDNPNRNAKTRERMKSLGISTEIIVHPGAKHGHWNRPDWIERVVADVVQFFEEHL
ncbi:MAG: SMP-30/gluconolactonase/LRE family protein [Planctomycetota bacterium]